MTIKERISKAIDTLQVNREEVFNKLGIDASSFRGKRRDQGINSQTVENFLILHPEVSAEYIMREEGNMFRDCNILTGEHAIQNNNAGDVVGTIHAKADTVGGHMVVISPNSDHEKIIKKDEIIVQSQQAADIANQQQISDLMHRNAALIKEVENNQLIINALNKTLETQDALIASKDEVIASKDQLINHLTAN